MPVIFPNQIPIRLGQGDLWRHIQILALAVVLVPEVGCDLSPRRRCFTGDYLDAKMIVVIGHPKFAEELSLTRDQAQLIRSIDDRPFTEREKTIASNSTNPIPPPETLKLMGQISGEIINSTLQHVLSTFQYKRFQEIMLQVYGPSMILVYDEIATNLHLSEKQMSDIERIVKSYEKERRPLINALGRYSIGGSTGLENMRGSEDSKARQLVQRHWVSVDYHYYYQTVMSRIFVLSCLPEAVFEPISGCTLFLADDRSAQRGEYPLPEARGHA